MPPAVRCQVWRWTKRVCLLGWPALAFVLAEAAWRQRRGLHGV